ncbi:MAG: amino acid ABC transporter permease, partial [bacterium]
MLKGLLVTLELSALGFVLSLAFGIVVALCRLSENRLVRIAATAYVEFFRNVPMIVLVFFLYFGLGMGSFAAGLLGLVLYSAPFFGEVIRSGIGSIPHAQFEAAHASGLSSFQVVRYVILPQAVAIVLPPLATEAVNIIKNTAIVPRNNGQPIIKYGNNVVMGPVSQVVRGFCPNLPDGGFGFNPYDAVND